MDVETSEAIDLLRGELVEVEKRLTAEIAESRVHAKVLTERVQDDVRLVAEGIAVLTVKVDALAR